MGVRTYQAEQDYANFQAEQRANYSRNQPQQPNQHAKAALLRDFVSKQSNLNTRKKTEQCVSRFRNWLRETHQITTQLHFIPADDLDTYLGQWLLAIKRMARIKNRTCLQAFTEVLRDTSKKMGTSIEF